jgi:hypothetical protein
MIEMTPSSRDLSYTVFKKGLIKFIRNVSIVEKDLSLIKNKDFIR